MSRVIGVLLQCPHHDGFYVLADPEAVMMTRGPSLAVSRWGREHDERLVTCEFAHHGLEQ